MSEFRNFKRILIPLDGSKRSENALAYGISMSEKYKADLVIVTVFSSKDPDSIFKKRIKEMNPKLAGDIEDMPVKYLMETYHDILKSTIENQGIKVRNILKEGKITPESVAKIIQGIVKKEHFDLVVMSSHGKSGFKKSKLGSVAEELILLLEIPFLCVKE